MRKIIILTVCTVFCILNSTFAQYENPSAMTTEEQNQSFTYIGLSSGINNFNGLIGGFLEIHPAKKVSLAGGLGIGMWGFKASAGVKDLQTLSRRFLLFRKFLLPQRISGY